MSVIRGKKYMILEYPTLNLDDLVRVRVKKLYKLPSGREIVEYDFNHPFPIVRRVEKKKFQSWIATEVE